MEREQFVGAWNLVSYEDRSDDGRVVQPYGPSPYGRLMYDFDGNMSVLLMASGRDKFESNNSSRSTPDEAKAAFDAFMAYCGMYRIDEEQGAVIHQLEASSFPNWENTEQVRLFSFSGNQMELNSPPSEGGRTSWVLSLLWERINP